MECPHFAQIKTMKKKEKVVPSYKEMKTIIECTE